MHVHVSALAEEEEEEEEEEKEEKEKEADQLHSPQIHNVWMGNFQQDLLLAQHVFHLGGGQALW